MDLRLYAQTKIFPEISALAFQHPHDLAATEALRKVPLLGTFQKWLMQHTSEPAWNLHLLMSAVELGPNQGKRIYEAFEHAAKVLDLPVLPKIYVINNPSFNAFAAGVENYSITLTSGLIDSLDDDELLAVIGHELGHIKCDHMLYKRMAHFMSTIGTKILDQVVPGLGQLTITPLLFALLHWSRMAEYSCDRAALLVTQDPETVKRTMVMIAAGSKKILPDLSIDAVLQQAKQYQDIEMSSWDKLLIFHQEMQMTHPVPVIRCQEIHEWSLSPEYLNILQGSYLKHSDIEVEVDDDSVPEEDASLFDNLSEKANDFWQRFKK